MSAQAADQAEKDAIAEKILQAVVAMQPTLRERAAQTKRDRQVPDETIQELQDIGAFLTLHPKRYGGYELDPQHFFKMPEMEIHLL